MNTSAPLYKIELRDSVHVVSFRRDIFDPESVEQLRAEVRALIVDAGASRFVIDCSNLRHVSSVFLGALLEIGLKLRGQEERDGLRLCGMTPQIREVFGVMRLDGAVEIHPTLPEALASFGAGA